MLWKKDGIPERKYKSYISENWFEKRSNQEYVKENPRERIGNRDDAVKQYHISEKKRKKEMKDLKNQNKVLVSTTKLLGSRLELKKIKKIYTKAYKNHDYSSRNSSSSDSYY